MGAALRLPAPADDTPPIQVAEGTTRMSAAEAQAHLEALQARPKGHRRPVRTGPPITRDELRARAEAERLRQLALPPTADPAHLRARGEAGETAAVWVRSSYPVGDYSIVTCVDVEDATRVYEFGALGAVSRGATGTVSFRGVGKVMGWVFQASGFGVGL